MEWYEILALVVGLAGAGGMLVFVGVCLGAGMVKVPPEDERLLSLKGRR